MTAGATVAVTGANGPLGRRVCDLVLADPSVGRLVRMDAIPGAGLAEPEAVAELARLLEGADAVVHLGSSLGTELDGTGAAHVDVEGATRLLTAAAQEGVATLVVVTSAMVYGAWANNPVPLTEDHPLRPNAGLPLAVRYAEVERRVGDWQAGHPGARVVVLRPTVALAAESRAWFARSLWSRRSLPPRDPDPPAQFVHLDDLAHAVDLARRGPLGGIYNVAPGGWIPGGELRALAGPASRLRAPARIGERLAVWRWRLGLTSTPPEVLPYVLHPWVVASDRLRAAGWEPEHTSEETFVAASPEGPLEGLSSRRRQELALAATGVVAAGAVAGAATLVVRARRRRRA